MSKTLTEVWSQVTAYLDAGLSIIPVRDKAEIVNGNKYEPKTPYYKWREYQERHITREELWELMDEKDTTAIAVVCGKISGNLEIIDVDVKYKPGIDAVLLTDIKKFYPQLFSRLRIHRSRSGGLHFLYFISGGKVPGNMKLAGREATQEEVQAQIDKGVKRPNKEINFLETRGEGGYALIPPSMGYEVHTDNPIPVITWEERCSLIALCQTYNEVVKEAPKPKPTKSQDSYYSENPFEHFNNTADPTELAEMFGWKFSHENQRFIWYTRPGKTSGVSMSWNKDKRIYFVFTSSTELQPNRGYHASTLLAELRHGGDKKATYKDLVDRGYGIVKPKLEERIVKRAVVNGDDIPKNFSEDAKKTFQDLKISYQEEYPYGIFWEYDSEKSKYKISREDLYNIAFSLGYRSYREGIVKIDGSVVATIDTQDFFDGIKDYIKEEDAGEYTDICNAYEAFMQNSGKYTISRLKQLDDSVIVKDTPSAAFKFFRNCYIKITKDGIEKLPYEGLDGLVWQHKLIDRVWVDSPPDQCVYRDYLVNAVGIEGNVPDIVKKAIGYLCHEYKAENTGYIIVLVEMVADPMDGGGSGKNIFGNILKGSTSVCTVPGSMVQFNEKFLQPWNYQNVYFLADIPKKIDWPFLKEMATGTGILKKLYRDEISLESSEMPKILMNTNFSYEDFDGGLKRRIIPIEFTDFYTKSGGVDVTHGKMFPGDFTEEDWAGFDHYIADCLQIYFKDNCKLKNEGLTKAGWEKKFRNSYGEMTFDFIEDNIEQWVFGGFITIKDFNNTYGQFCDENDIPLRYRAGAKLMNMALKDYCDHHGYHFEPRTQRRVNGVSTKVKVFRKIDDDIEDIEVPF